MKAVWRVLRGVFAAFLGSAGGGVVGAVIGHVLGGGDKNVGLTVAIVGIFIGAVAMVGVLGWFARRSGDWRMVVGGVLAIVLEAAALAWVRPSAKARPSTSSSPFSTSAMPRRTCDRITPELPRAPMSEP